MNESPLQGLKRLVPTWTKKAESLVAQAAFGPLSTGGPSVGSRGVVEFLGQVSLFEELSRGELERLARSAHERTYHDGEYIYEQGKPGAALFLLRSGVVEIRRRKQDGDEVSLLTLTPPASFSEQAAMGIEPVRWTSAVARGPVSLLALGDADLDALGHRFPLLANKVLRKLAQITALRLQMLVETQFFAEEGSVADGSPSK